MPGRHRIPSRLHRLPDGVIVIEFRWFPEPEPEPEPTQNVIETDGEEVEGEVAA